MARPPTLSLLPLLGALALEEALGLCLCALVALAVTIDFELVFLRDSED